ncbi:MAG TPA: hypothetical protein VHL11_11575, partial [Phototrophicaceae bacterium]|nr:hypothetical protein [Phototrophicaceae bacterium]
LVKNIPNHDDDGTVTADPTAIGLRQVTGLFLTGTFDDPILYVTSSDPRRGVDGDLNLDTNSGIISRLTQNDEGGWDMVHLVRGLPRSEEYHATNGLTLDSTTNTLFVMNGGNTNMGSPGTKFSYTPEYALTNAMLAVNLNVIDAMPVLTDGSGQKYVYDLPTIDDPERGLAGQPDPNDPFGGDDGLNQAMVVPGGPVQLYATGFRNPFDVVLTQGTHRLYTFDNGPNSQWGGRVIGEGVGGACTNQPNENDSASYSDNLHYVTQGFYGGHPNPVRGDPDNAKLYRYKNIGGTEQLDQIYDFTATWSPVPFNLANPTECDFRASFDEDGMNGIDDGSLAQIPASTNGITDYTASNFGDAMNGNLLAASYDGNIYRFALNANGNAVTTQEALLNGFGAVPLDVTTQGDLDIFPGTIWAVTYIANNITVFEPADFVECLGTYDAGLDEDLDGYNNADEIDNGTNPCSGGSTPSDFDGDFVSDLNDPDDDNDTIVDLIDAFQIDNTNGTSANLPLDYPFFNNDPGTGFFGLGFTGLMVNGTTDYLTMYDPVNLTAGGATGRFTIDAASAGDATGATNTQQNAFQIGLNVDANTGIFSAEARQESPFFNNLDPVDGQLQGAYIGSGDQDSYLRIGLIAGNGSGALQVTLEEGGSVVSNTVYSLFTSSSFTDADNSTNLVNLSGVTDTASLTANRLDGNNAGGAASLSSSPTVVNISSLDFSFVVDPALNFVQPRYRANGGAWINLGGALAVPADWFTVGDGKGLALGLITTAGDSGIPFTATWDYFRATLENIVVVTPTPTITPTDSPTETPTATPTEIPGQELLVNGGFEDDLNSDSVPDAWKGGHLTGDKRKCDTADKVVAYEGLCAFAFKGTAGEKSKLLQKIDITGISFVSGDSLLLTGYVNAKTASVSGKVLVKVTYASLPADVQKINLVQTTGYLPLQIPLSLAGTDVTGIKVQIT